MQPWTRYQDDEVVKVGWRTIVTKHFIRPDGKQQIFDTVGRIDDQTATVIALTPDNQAVITTQFRAGPEAYFDELPGGMVDVGEDPQVAAMRELLEETGYGSDQPPEFLGNTYVDGYANTKRSSYLLRNCYKKAEPTHEEGELIDIKLISIEELIHNAKHARMSDCVAVFQAYETLQTLVKRGNNEKTN